MAAPLKDLIDRGSVEAVADRFATVDSSFDRAGFVDALWPAIDALELKPRIAAIATAIHDSLARPYLQALEVVVDVSRAEPHIDGFEAWALCSFVELYGVDEPAASLAAMEHLTKRSSCEFAIRPFLEQHWDAAFETLHLFAQCEDEAVRRLPSEGTRPKLPWGTGVRRLLDEPAAGLALLEVLRHDESETVRRSVANHLNDVAKSNPGLVVETVRRWVSESPPVDQRMVSHALRTLVKQGNSDALALLGFTTDAAVEVEAFTVQPSSVEIGGSIELAADIISTSDDVQRLVVDFVVHHVLASGGTSPKVFKWTTLRLEPGERVELTKRRRIEQASTRTYRSGRHDVELQLAGRVVRAASFDLVV